MPLEQLIQYYKGNLDVKEIVNSTNLQSIDEALNICDLTRVTEKFRLWQKHLPNILPFYAVKCNDDINILRVLADLKVNFDCASKNEIAKILDLGVSPDRIIFANPCKPKSHVEFAKETGVKRATVDSEFEIYKIYKYFPEMEVVVRFKCDAKEAQCPLGDKFGCTAENDAIAIMLLARGLGLKVIGVSFHVGSGCNDYKAYERAIKTAKHLFDIGSNLGFQMRLVDIGGGFPGDNDSGFEAISNIINGAVGKYFKGEDLEIIAEPGRFFAASAYTLVCKIHAKREIRNENKLDTVMYYLNDGIYGMFNCILFDHQTVSVDHILETSDDVPKLKSLIWGPTCDALDKISENLFLPNLNCGDYLVFPNMGAYSLPIASTFNGFMRPKSIYFQKLE